MRLYPSDSAVVAALMLLFGHRHFSVALGFQMPTTRPWFGHRCRLTGWFEAGSTLRSRTNHFPLGSASVEHPDLRSNNFGQSCNDNKAMQFLKKIGRVGGYQDFTHAIGIDEGRTGKSTILKKVRTELRKSNSAHPDIASSAATNTLTATGTTTSVGDGDPENPASSNLLLL